MSQEYRPEVYAKFRYEMRLLDRPTQAFVMGLKSKLPEVFNELAAIAHDFGGVAMVHAVRACLEVCPESRQNMLKTAGYKLLQEGETISQRSSES